MFVLKAIVSVWWAGISERWAEEKSVG